MGFGRCPLVEGSAGGAFNGFEIRNWRGPKGTMCGGPRAAPGRSFVRTGVMDGQDDSGV